MDYDVKGKDNVYARETISKSHQSFDIALGTMWIGKQVNGLEVHLTQEQLKLWNQPSSATPHVTLAIARGNQTTDIGHMVTHLKRALKATLGGSSQAKGLWKIGVDRYCWSGCGGTVKAVFEMVDLSETTGSEKLPGLLEQAPTCLWATHANDVGRIRSMHPVKINIDTSKKLPRKPQYPLPPEAEAGIAPEVEALLKQGTIIPTVSQCNTPILPVRKPGKLTWRFVQDLRAVNEAVIPTYPIVANPATILASIPSNTTHFTVIDLCSAFFSVPIAPESQFLFAFMYQGRQ